MLTEIYLKNYTVIESLHLSLKSGLSVVSGETGAGKSIVVDAVNLALGARADLNVIRQDEAQCDITLCFSINNNPKAVHWLEENQFNDDNECIITRNLTAEGRSRATINGKPCTLSLIRSLAEHLLTIHGQHESQSLMQRDTQMHYVDLFGKHQPQLEQLATIAFDWRKNKSRLEALQALAAQRDEQLALLRYQLEELNQASVKPDEWQQLHQQHQKMHNAKELIQRLNQALDLTVDNDPNNAMQLLFLAIEEIKSIPDPELKAVNELLNSAAIHIEEAGNELHLYRNSLNLSPSELTQIENRLTLIHDLARKHHVTPEELTQVTQSLEQKITDLENNETLIQQLTITNKKHLENYQRIAGKLTKNRKKCITIINKKITQSMNELGMQGGEFIATLEPHHETVHPMGAEKIIFIVKTNPGQNPGPLAKVASGGELSRISLALQTIIAEKEQTPTFIFDEIDVGIGGKTADIVGKLLRQLSQDTQVLCITHLPQVASHGNHHYKVIKTSAKNKTKTHISLLNKQKRIEEIARMISGASVTKETLVHAEQMLI